MLKSILNAVDNLLINSNDCVLNCWWTTRIIRIYHVTDGHQSVCGRPDVQSPWTGHWKVLPQVWQNKGGRNEERVRVRRIWRLQGRRRCSLRAERQGIARRKVRVQSRADWLWWRLMFGLVAGFRWREPGVRRGAATNGEAMGAAVVAVMVHHVAEAVISK